MRLAPAISAPQPFGPKPHAATTALRFVRVTGDMMEPVLRRGDYVLVAPLRDWSGEGDYLLHGWTDGTIYRCSGWGSRETPIKLTCVNPLYMRSGPLCQTREDFSAQVVGKVVARLNVIEPALLREAIPLV